MRNKFHYCLLVSGLLLCAGIVTRAQSSSTGEIRGTVTDPTGAVVPDATVSVMNVNTGVEKAFRTNRNGIYDTVSTPNGQYKITITAPGFEKLVLGPITLDVGTITLDGPLRVGSDQQQIVISADTAALLNTESGEQSTTFDEKTMLQLPQVGQDWANFTILLPGSAGASSANGVTTSGVGVSLNGGAPYSGNFLSDGGSVTNPHSADVETDTFETVAEVQIEDSNFSAQYGIGGAVFSQITKGGENKFHGSAYEHFQNDALEARSYFAAPGQHVGPLKFNQFGGAIGGPILHNRMFFYFNYDKSIDNQSYTGFSTMPTDRMKGANGEFDETQLEPLDSNGRRIPLTDSNGNIITNPCNGATVYTGEIFDPATQITVGGNPCRFPFANDNVIPANRIDNVARNLLQDFQEPNQSVSQGIVNDYYFLVPTPYPSTRIFGRIDYDFNSKNRLTSSIAVRDANSPVYTEWKCPVACYHDDTSDYSSQTSDVWSFSSTFVNEARFSFTRQGSFLTPFSLGLGIPEAIGLKYAKANVMPNWSIGGICCDSLYNGINTNTIYAQNVYQPSDVVTLIRGKHILHFGGELIMLECNCTAWGNVDAGDFNFSGQYTQANQNATGSGAGWADFLLGDVGSWGAANSPLFGGREKSPQLFIQDDYKIRSNLTLNLGIRYQIQRGWNEVQGRQGEFDPTIFNTASNSYGAMWFAPANHRTQTQANVYSGVLPRVGFAFTPKLNTVLRGGFGIYTTPWSVDQYEYNSTTGVGYSSSGNAQDQTNGVTPITKFDGPGVIYGTNTPLPYLQASRSPTAYNGQGVNYDPYHTPLTKMYSWSLGVQHEFGQGITAEVAYVGKHGANMQFKGDINQVSVNKLSVNDNPSGRPFPQYQGIGGSTFNAVSNYNALQAQAKKRLANGIAFTAAYTWSKFLNDMDVSPFNGAGGNVFFQNFHDPGSNYAPSNFDIRESLKTSLVYQLPFGKGRTYLNSNRLLDSAIGGWQVSVISINQSGNPFTVTYNGPNNSYSQAGNWYPNVLRPAQNRKKGLEEWYDPTAYVVAANGTFGNSQRNSLRAHGIDTQNASIGKTFHIVEGVGLQFRADASNVFNHPNFDAPDGNFNDPVNLSTPDRPQGAGTISRTTVGGRNMQLSARFEF